MAFTWADGVDDASLSANQQQNWYKACETFGLLRSASFSSWRGELGTHIKPFQIDCLSPSGGVGSDPNSSDGLNKPPQCSMPDACMNSCSTLA